MNHSSIFVSIFCIALFYSCADEDLCVQRVQYTKAVGVYENLQQFRNNEINSPPRALVNPGKIYVSNNLLLIGEEGEGIHVVDNGDPFNPNFINFLSIPGHREMFVLDDKVYVDSYFDMLQLDISNPRNVQVEIRLEEAFPPRLRDEQNRALVDFYLERVDEELACDVRIQDGSVVHFDFKGERIPESALPTSFVSSSNNQQGTVNRMALINEYLYVIGNRDMYIFDVSENNLSRSKHLDYFSREMETIYPLKDLLFVGSLNSMTIYNTIRPLQPRFVSEFRHATSCDPVLPTEDGVAYVTLRSGNECPGDENTLNVVDITNVQNPFLLTSIALTSPYAMSIANGILFVGEGDAGYRMYEIDGQNLNEIAHDPSITAYDIISHPSQEEIVLFAGPGGISQYHLSGSDLSLVSRINY